MTSPGSVSGIASGIQWRDLIDQIGAAEEARSVTPLVQQASSASTGAAAWTTYQSLVAKLGDAAKVLADGVVDNVMTSVGASSSGRQLFTAAPATDGTPGTYLVEVVATAKSHKLSGGSFSSDSAALNLSGTVRVNGRPVAISAGQSLADIRDAINAANTGSTRSGVSATILSVAGSSHRLVLTSDDSGAAGIELADTAGTVLGALGLTTGTLAANVGATGDSRSFGFADASDPIATVLGLASPPAATTMSVGNVTIAVNLATDSLDALAARLVAAGVAAEVVEEETTVGTRHRLEIGGRVSGDLSNADRAATLELLGLVRRTFDSVAQVVTSEDGLDAAADADATGATQLVDLRTGGASMGLASGDAITLRATRGDGVVQTGEVAVTGTTTIEEIRAALQTLYGATATVTFESNGTFRIVDATGGESRLAAQLLVRKASGEVQHFGRMVTTTAGYARQVVAGQDAHIRVDGVDVVRRTNSIGDAISGTTLNLVSAQAGDVVRLDITRDTGTATGAAQKLVAAYNEIAAYVKKATATGGALAMNNSVRSSLRSITSRLIGEVPGLTGTTRAGQAGITVDKNGVMSIDAAVFKQAVADDLPAIRSLFGKTVTAPTGLSYLGATENSGSGSFAVAITAAAAGPVATGSGFNGSYTAAAPGETMLVTDSGTLETATIPLDNGDDTDTIAGKLNAQFLTRSMPLTASNSGGQLVVTGATVGSSAKFNVGYGGGGTAAAQLGIAAGQFAGTNVVGTLGGVAAIGDGHRLTGAEGTTADGIALRHTSGAPLGGTLVHTLGIGDIVRNLATLVTRDGDGLAVTQKTSLERRVTRLNERADVMRDRIARRRETLILQFTRMEGAMALLQTQTAALTNGIAALQSSRK